MITELNPEWLVIRVLIISVSTIGLVQWLKNFINPKHKRGYAIVSLFITSICVVMHSPYVPAAITVMFSLFSCALAVNQIAYDYIIRGVQSLVEKVMGGGEKK